VTICCSESVLGNTTTSWSGIIGLLNANRDTRKGHPIRDINWLLTHHKMVKLGHTSSPFRDVNRLKLHPSSVKFGRAITPSPSSDVSRLWRHHNFNKLGHASRPFSDVRWLFSHCNMVKLGHPSRPSSDVSWLLSPTNMSNWDTRLARRGRLAMSVGCYHTTTQLIWGVR